MRLKYYIAILIASVFCATSQIAQAAAAKGSGPHGGGKAASQMSSKGLENTNAQWSDDRERGLERAQERHELHESEHSTPPSKQSRGSHRKASKQKHKK